MKAAVLGSGLMGSVIAEDLSRSNGIDGVTVLDIDDEKLDALRKRIGSRRLSVDRTDLGDRAKTAKSLAGFDVVASALPHGVVHQADLAAVDVGARLVNIAFEDEQMELDGMARRKGATLIPGCGVAPGLGGILLRAGADELGGADEGHILVGGVPQHPQGPYGYKLVFSVVGLLREYIEPARVYRNSRLVSVDPFSEVEAVVFPDPIGEMEAFCTDGLASLVYTMKGMKTLDEKTLRWPGHAEKMKLLIDSGFFSKEKVRAGGVEVAPLELSWSVLGKKLTEGDPRDMTVMRVIASSGRRKVVYDMVDRYDDKKRVTSMGKTTGYTASIVTQMLGSGEVKGIGVVPPENAVTGRLVGKLVSELGERGVNIMKSRT